MKDKIITKSKTENSIDVSIIIPCKNEGENLKFTVDSIMNSKNYTGFEVIIIDDGCNDDSIEFLKSGHSKEVYKNIILIQTKGIGCAGARNEGAKVARGQYLFFCDAHVKVTDLWVDNLVNTLKEANGHIVAPCIINMVNMKNPLPEGYGMTVNDRLISIWLSDKPNEATEIPFACGCAFGISKEVFKNLHGFNTLFKGYGSEDFEICLKAWLYGYRVILNPYVKVEHLFKTKRSYEISSHNTIYNILCLAYSHFNKERIIKTIDIVKGCEGYCLAIENIKGDMNAIIKQREKYLKERIYDDDFFFKKFNILF